MPEVDSTEPATDLRKQAATALEAKRDFTTHVFIYVLVNAVLVGVWGHRDPRRVVLADLPDPWLGNRGCGPCMKRVRAASRSTDAEIVREEHRLREKHVALRGG